MTHDPLLTVQRFARSLDTEDYEEAKRLLASDCQYRCRGELMEGPEEIIASYQHNGAAESPFDQTKYESFVERQQEDWFRIRFVDHVTHRDSKFTFESDQIVRVDDAGRICEIEHHDLPGMLDALADFRKSVGLS